MGTQQTYWCSDLNLKSNLCTCEIKLNETMSKVLCHNRPNDDDSYSHFVQVLELNNYEIIITIFKFDH